MSTSLPAKQFLDQVAQQRLAVADAAGLLTDDQLCRSYNIRPGELIELRADPAYQALVQQQVDYFRNKMAYLRFEAYNLGELALDNAKHFLQQRDSKHCWAATEFVLKTILPQRQEVNVNVANAPHFSAEATVIINERTASYQQSLKDVASVPALDDDPNLVPAG